MVKTRILDIFYLFVNFSLIFALFLKKPRIINFRYPVIYFFFSEMLCVILKKTNTCKLNKNETMASYIFY